ncbi:DUF5710 domain-containing protein [Paraburkholderia fungorum]|uniref:DUF5710 domain-containing protein n=1 Tax=Paraburkholderia fungorum TaxID=134537 RepID=UPI0038BE10D0
MKTKIHLYRHYDAAGRLLYVGISLNAYVRLAQHMVGADWASLAVRMDVETFDTWEAAHSVEREAIRLENPLYNVQRYKESTAKPEDTAKPFRPQKHGKEQVIVHEPDATVWLRQWTSAGRTEGEAVEWIRDAASKGWTVLCMEIYGPRRKPLTTPDSLAIWDDPESWARARLTHEYERAEAHCRDVERELKRVETWMSLQQQRMSLQQQTVTWTILNVPYAEKDEAKALGARWDPPARKWRVPSNIDHGPFARWMPVNSR